MRGQLVTDTAAWACHFTCKVSHAERNDRLAALPFPLGSGEGCSSVGRVGLVYTDLP